MQKCARDHCDSAGAAGEAGDVVTAAHPLSSLSLSSIASSLGARFVAVLRTYVRTSLHLPPPSVRVRPRRPRCAPSSSVRPSSADLALFGGAAAASSQLIRRWGEGGRAFVVQRDWFGAAAALRGGSSSSTRGEESQRLKKEERGGKRNRRGRQREKRETERARGGGPSRRASLLLLLHDFLEAEGGGAAVSREGRVCWERESGEDRDALPGFPWQRRRGKGT